MDRGEHSLGKWISILYRYGQSYVSKKLEEYNIGCGQHVILLTLLRNGGISQEELAGHLKIDKGSIAKSIKKLEDEGYIEKMIDSDDKRAYKVFLTQKALDVMPQIQAALSSWEEIIVSDLSENEKQMVEQMMFKMAKKAYNVKENDRESFN